MSHQQDTFDELLHGAFKLPDAPVTGELEEVKRCPTCGANLRGQFQRCPADGSELEVADDPRIGRVVAGHYRLLERLGSGGVGTVYRARHRVIGRDVAVKFLRRELAYDDEQRARLLREAQTVGRLGHEHIASVIDFVSTDGELALVMEYVRGPTLSTAIAAGRFYPSRAVRVARQTALALARAHDLDVLHRDIKPGNIVLCRVDSEQDFVKLLDFGLAHVNEGGRLTSTGVVMGTPHYMAPEQVRGEALGPATDLYSLGCVLFEMLTGVPPFDGLPHEVVQGHARSAPPKPSAYHADIPADLDALVLRLLQKEPRARYRDAHHLIEALDAVALALPQEPVEASIPVRPSDGGFGATAIEQLERRWAERLSTLEQEAGSERGAGLASAFERARSSLERLRGLHAQMRDETEKLELLDVEHRARVERIASAVDALGRDESTTSRTLERLELDTAAAVVVHSRAIEDLCQVVTPELSLDTADRAALSALITSARELSAKTGQLRALRLRRAQLVGEREDLRFQTEQLRGRLAALQAEHRTHAEAAHLRMGALDARAQAETEAIAAALDEIGAALRESDAQGA